MACVQTRLLSRGSSEVCETGLAVLFSLSASKLLTSILVSEGYGHVTLCHIKRTLNEGQVSVSNQYDYGDNKFL